MGEGACLLCAAPGLPPARAGLRRCRRCGLYQRARLPSPAELRRRYDRQYYEAWGPQGGEDPAVGAMKARTFAARLALAEPLPPGARVLDVGCATGFFLDLVARRGAEPYGVEVSPYAARVAAARFPGRIVCGELAGAGYPAEMFHAVFLSDVVEHVLDPAALLREVFRVLRPGGCVVVTTPDAESPGARLLGRHWYHLKEEHLVYFTRRALRYALARAGFRALRFRPGRKAVTLAYLASHFRTYRRPGLTPLLALLARSAPASLARRPFWLPSGELVVRARRPESTANR